MTTFLLSRTEKEKEIFLSNIGFLKLDCFFFSQEKTKPLDLVVPDPIENPPNSSIPISPNPSILKTVFLLLLLGGD